MDVCSFSGRPRFLVAAPRPPNVLSLSRARPYRAWLATRKRRAKRGAEAPGQRTAARRLLRRVGPPVPLPFVQKRANRTIKDHYFRLLGGGTLPEHAERAPATRRK